MIAKDGLPGVTILMLDMALATLRRAAEAETMAQARAQITKAQAEISSVIMVAKEAASASEPPESN